MSNDSGLLFRYVLLLIFGNIVPAKEKRKEIIFLTYFYFKFRQPDFNHNSEKTAKNLSIDSGLLLRNYLSCCWFLEILFKLGLRPRLTVDRQWYYTLPRPSEISEKNWSKVIVDIAFMSQSHAESMKKSWEPFRIYQLTSTANPAQFHKTWTNWLYVLVSW